jgi:hypothetical protein
MCSTFCPNYKSIESKPIVVRVGHAKQEFFVHEKLLRASSEFFDMALKKEWKEGQEAAVDSSDAKPEYFRVWVKCLYIGRVYMREEKPTINLRRSGSKAHTLSIPREQKLHLPLA